MKINKAKAIIFDCDGTLSTQCRCTGARGRPSRNGITHFPVDILRALGGVPTRDILKMLSREQACRLITLPWRSKGGRVSAADRYRASRRRCGYCARPLRKDPAGGRRVARRKSLSARTPAFWAVRRHCTSDNYAPETRARHFLEAARRVGVPAANCRATKTPTWPASHPRCGYGRWMCGIYPVASPHEAGVSVLTPNRSMSQRSWRVGSAIRAEETARRRSKSARALDGKLPVGSAWPGQSQAWTGILPKVGAHFSLAFTSICRGVKGVAVLEPLVGGFETWMAPNRLSCSMRLAMSGIQRS